MGLNAKIERTVTLKGANIGDETEILKFLADDDGVYISSFRQEFEEESQYFSLQLTYPQFEALLFQLSQLKG